MGRLERAKKRLVYSLLRLGLPLDGAAVGKAPLNFDFVNDALTGHLDGVITSQPGRGGRRRAGAAAAGRWHEPYRTMLGHFRHEMRPLLLGRLIKAPTTSSEFRTLFGDERADYERGAAAPLRSPGRRPTGVASSSRIRESHPWEDWAETWAHYLHMVDTLETAAVHRLEPRAGRFGGSGTWPMRAFDVYRTEAMKIKRWVPLTLALNDINRSMGHEDFYPFVIPEVAATKMMIRAV